METIVFIYLISYIGIYMVRYNQERLMGGRERRNAYQVLTVFERLENYDFIIGELYESIVGRALKIVRYADKMVSPVIFLMVLLETIFLIRNRVVINKQITAFLEFPGLKEDPIYEKYIKPH